MGLCPCLCLSVTSRCSTKTAERIGLVFGMGASFDQSYTVLKGNSCTFKNKGTSLWNFASNSGLRKFRHSKSSVYRWYPQLVHRRFVYDRSETMRATRRVMVECTQHGDHRPTFITHWLQLNLQLHTIDLVRTCRISSFCTVAWQLARFKLTRRIARSLGDSELLVFKHGIPVCTKKP